MAEMLFDFHDESGLAPRETQNTRTPPRVIAPLRASDETFGSGPQSHHMGCAKARSRRRTLDGNQRGGESRYEREFQELNIVGRGGFGAVFKARNRLDSNLYAVKKTRFQLRPKEAFTMKNKSDAFLSEVAILSKMDHPHVVRYYAAWIEEEWSTVKREEEKDGLFASFAGSEDSEEEMPVGSPCYCITVYMQMALYEDDNLMARIENEDRVVDPGCNLTVLVQILQGLKYMHEQGVIHRDIKPSNIFFNQDGTIKIGDLGLSIVDTSASRSRCNSVDMDAVPHLAGASGGASSHTVSPGVGTPVYASPEQLAGRSSTFASDVFSIGVIMFELYHPAFHSRMERYRTIAQVRLGDLPAALEAQFPHEAAIMMWCLAADPLQRPTCEQLLARDASISWLHHEMGGASLTTSPLCGSVPGSSNRSTSSTTCTPNLSPNLSPAASPKVVGSHGPLLNYLDYNFPAITSTTKPHNSPLPTSSPPPQLLLGATIVKRDEAINLYRKADHSALLEMVVERDEQIEALQARIARMEDILLANGLSLDTSNQGAYWPGMGMDCLNL